jgi:hypothetical protein
MGSPLTKNLPVSKKPAKAAVELRKQGFMQPSATERRLKIIIVGGLFAGMVLSPALWLSDRSYPATPVWPFSISIPVPLDHLVFAVILATLAAIAVVTRPAKLIGLFSLLAIGLALLDQSRWQPWFYQYLVMLIALGLYDYSRGGHDDIHNPALNACRLVVVCTYFWSGLQKLHPGFRTYVFHELTKPITHLLPPSIVPAFNWLAMVAPFIEAGIGIGLLTRRFRTWAIFGAFGMHAFILLAIGPLGRDWNSVVWPWNVAMLCFVTTLFWQRPKLSASEIVWSDGGRYQKVILLLFTLAPVLSFFNLWDGYLSSALYSGTRNTANIYVTNSLADRLPKDILQHVYVTEKPGTNTIKLIEWSISELNVPSNPEPRIYKNLARYICAYAHDPSEAKLVIKQTGVLFAPDKELSYDCSSLGR